MFLTKIYFTIDSHIPNRRVPVFGQQTKLTPNTKLHVIHLFGFWTPKSQQKPSPTTVGVKRPHAQKSLEIYE